MGDGAHNVKAIVEALLFAGSEPVRPSEIREILAASLPPGDGTIRALIEELRDDYRKGGRSFTIAEIAGGYRLQTLPEYGDWISRLRAAPSRRKLSAPALETLAIVAYRQPVTKAEIEHIRGVASDGVLQNLLEKNMVAIRGRAATVGKPLQYGTTDEFLKFFGLAGLDDLPKMKEIEELIRAAEPDNGDQLSFETSVLDVAMARKLNVADGTFDPQTREAAPQDDDRPAPPPGARTTRRGVTMASANGARTVAPGQTTQRESAPLPSTAAPSPTSASTSCTAADTRAVGATQARTPRRASHTRLAAR